MWNCTPKCDATGSRCTSAATSRQGLGISTGMPKRDAVAPATESRESLPGICLAPRFFGGNYRAEFLQGVTIYRVQWLLA